MFLTLIFRNVRLLAYPCVYLRYQIVEIKREVWEAKSIKKNERVIERRKGLPGNLVIWHPLPPFINHFVSHWVSPCFRASIWYNSIMISTAQIHIFSIYFLHLFVGFNFIVNLFVPKNESAIAAESEISMEFDMLPASVWYLLAFAHNSHLPILLFYQRFGHK